MCGIAAVVSRNGEHYDVIPELLQLMNGVQKRGELAAGATALRQGNFETMKITGYVEELQQRILESVQRLSGWAGIGHARYDTCNGKDPEFTQPFIASSITTPFALAFNGNVPGFARLKDQLLTENLVLEKDVDTDVLRLLMQNDMVSQIAVNGRIDMCRVFAGLQQKMGNAACSIASLRSGGTIDLYRDALGMRPLAYCVTDTVFAAASETHALANTFPGSHIVEVKPGECVSYSASQGITSSIVASVRDKAHCFFEWNYFANVDTTFEGVYARKVREEIGRQIAARDTDLPEDVLVVPVPNSGMAYADGYVQERGILCKAIGRNENVGRTFIINDFHERLRIARLKYPINGDLIRGKNIVVVDDSGVRGTTLEVLVCLLSEFNPASIHIRFGSPPITTICEHGIAINKENELMARKVHSDVLRTDVLPEEELQGLAAVYGVDSLRYASVNDTVEAIGLLQKDLCMRCVTGKVPQLVDLRIKL